MTCREIFDKIKTQTELHEQKLHHKMEESQSNLKNILKKIKNDMEKNAIYSDVNYNLFQSSTALSTEKKEVISLKHSKQNDKKLNNCLKNILFNEHKKVHLNKPKRRKLIINTRNIGKSIFNNDSKTKTPLLITKDSTNYFSSYDGYNIDPHRKLLKTYSVTSVNSFQLNGNDGLTHINKQNDKRNAKHLKTFSAKKANDIKNFKISKSEYFNISPIPSQQNCSSKTKKTSIFQRHSLSQRNNLQNKVSSKPVQIITHFPIENLNDIEYHHKIESPSFGESTNDEMNINTIHSNRKFLSNSKSGNNDENTSHSKRNETSCSSTIRSGKRPLIKRSSKQYFDLLNKIDILKQQTKFLEKKVASKNTTQLETLSESNIKKPKKSKSNKKMKVKHSQENLKPIYPTYEDYKMDESKVFDIANRANANNNFHADFNKEDNFGELIDNIIHKSFKARRCIQCESCVSLLSDGKSTVLCKNPHYKYDYIKSE